MPERVLYVRGRNNMLRSTSVFARSRSVPGRAEAHITSRADVRLLCCAASEFSTWRSLAHFDSHARVRYWSGLTLDTISWLEAEGSLGGSGCRLSLPLPPPQSPSSPVHLLLSIPLALREPPRRLGPGRTEAHITCGLGLGLSRDIFFLRKQPGGEYHLISRDRGTNQIARKALLTCVVYTNCWYTSFGSIT